MPEPEEIQDGWPEALREQGRVLRVLELAVEAERVTPWGRTPMVPTSAIREALGLPARDHVAEADALRAQVRG